MDKQRRTRFMTVSSSFQPRLDIEHKTVAKISLIGIWVENAGFKTGDKFTVDVEPNRILINRMEPVAPPPVPDKKPRRKPCY